MARAQNANPERRRGHPARHSRHHGNAMRPMLKKHDKHTLKIRAFAKGRLAARKYAILSVSHNSFSASRLQTLATVPTITNRLISYLLALFACRLGTIRAPFGAKSRHEQGPNTAPSHSDRPGTMTQARRVTPENITSTHYHHRRTACQQRADFMTLFGQKTPSGYFFYYKVTKGSSLDQLLLALILLAFIWLDEKLNVSYHTSFNGQLPYDHARIFRKEQLPPCHWRAINNSIYKRPKTF